jgi:hypothetical protein
MSIADTRQPYCQGCKVGTRLLYLNVFTLLYYYERFTVVPIVTFTCLLEQEVI